MKFFGITSQNEKLTIEQNQLNWGTQWVVRKNRKILYVGSWERCHAFMQEFELTRGQ